MNTGYYDFVGRRAIQALMCGFVSSCASGQAPVCAGDYTAYNTLYHGTALRMYADIDIEFVLSNAVATTVEGTVLATAYSLPLLGFIDYLPADCIDIQGIPDYDSSGGSDDVLLNGTVDVTTNTQSRRTWVSGAAIFQNDCGGVYGMNSESYAEVSATGQAYSGEAGILYNGRYYIFEFLMPAYPYCELGKGIFTNYGGHSGAAASVREYEPIDEEEYWVVAPSVSINLEMLSDCNCYLYELQHYCPSCATGAMVCDEVSFGDIDTSPCGTSWRGSSEVLGVQFIDIGFEYEDVTNSASQSIVKQAVVARHMDGTYTRLGFATDTDFTPDMSGNISVEDFGVSVGSTLQSPTDVSSSIEHDAYSEQDGDIDRDDMTCFDDRGELMSKLGLSIGMAGYTPRADIDLDGDIDQSDVLAFNALPCNADVNCDGMVTPSDVTAWYPLFNSNDPKADTNGDGMFMSNDFTAFIAAYNVGCE